MRSIVYEAMRFSVYDVARLHTGCPDKQYRKAVLVTIYEASRSAAITTVASCLIVISMIRSFQSVGYNKH